eukprot:TRINITY_DN4230_c0_g2_i2.p1 TRINITY_DN4230_c0_g2~~TRINITY_DN4230_c0_g2_i2.p1  ORF type:complete len:781 (-),score=158.03 TRINITY_DN4230_c0_g2_i2:28-2370(-)
MSLFGIGAINHNPSFVKEVYAACLNSGSLSRAIRGCAMNSFLKCGEAKTVLQLLKEMDETDIDHYIGTTVLCAYATQVGSMKHALDFFEMLSRRQLVTVHSWAAMFSVISRNRDEGCLRVIHAQLIQSGIESTVPLLNAMILAFGKCGMHQQAKSTFEGMSVQDRDAASWSAIISGCAVEGDLVYLKEVHRRLQESGMAITVPLSTGLIFAYAKCNDIATATDIFDQLPSTALQDPLLWCAYLAVISQDLPHLRRIHAHILHSRCPLTTELVNGLLNAYIRCGDYDTPQVIFNTMRQDETNATMWKPDQHTYISLLTASKLARSLQQTMDLHRLIEGSFEDRVVNNCILDAYIECGSLDLAEMLFAKMQNLQDVDTVTWNTMMFAYSKDGRYREATELLDQMKQFGSEPDALTWSALALACGSTSCIEEGKALYQRIRASPFAKNPTLLSYLITMFAKCGSLDMALEIWDSIPTSERNDDLVTSMMFAWGSRGQVQPVLSLYRAQESPSNDMTTAALNACSHAGKVVDALHIYESAKKSGHDRTWTTMNHNSLIDALCRAKMLDLAEAHTENFVPDRITWMTILSGCKFADDTERAPRIAEKALQFNEDASTYVLLSNIFASVRDYNMVTSIRGDMKRKGIKKIPGRVKVEVDGQITEFVVNDQTHPQGPQIRALLHELFAKMYAQGFAHDHDAVLREFESADEERVHLCEHSEKLAIGFALLNTKEGTPIKLVKNLRVCADCHEATKAISKITNRVITVRDANRWHQFKDGQCDCNDYF